ncbi:MAG TPA: hypothetical protein PLD02_14670 [Saprospiraceae bacterium]|nr:hypothetical protein [Saprospiraceae bacterium]
MPSSTPQLQSATNNVPEFDTPTNSVASFLANPSLWRKSGSSYFGRLDFDSEVDNTYTPPPGSVDLIFGGTGFEVDGGTDLYIGTVMDADREAVWLPLPAISLTNLYVASSVAPGSGQTFTFTVYKDTTATAMTAQISGSGTSASYGSSTITFSAGEKFSVRIVTSAGAQTAYLTYSVRLQ